MRILAVSTAEQGCSLAIVQDKTLVCEEYWASRQTHSKRLVAMVKHLLENRAGLTPGDMDGFIAAKGPGSFTGIRIGISVIKGLAYALSRPDAGVSSLDGIAWRFSHAASPVCAMMDARRNQVYCAVYCFEQGTLVRKTREIVCSPEQAVGLAGNQALFVGSGSKLYQHLILSLTGQAAVFSHESMDPVSAAALSWAAFSQEDFFHRPENRLVPAYIRKSDAEIQSDKTSREKPILTK